MKKVNILILSFILLSSFIFAQTGGGGGSNKTPCTAICLNASGAMSGTL